MQVVSRIAIQDQGDWQIDYRLKYLGSAPVIAATEEVSAQLEGWVSNSRAVGHAVPRRSRVAVSGGTGMQGEAEVIASEDEEKRCHERVVVQIQGEDSAGNPAGRIFASPVSPTNGAGSEPDTGASASARISQSAELVSNATAQVFRLVPGGTFRVRLRLEHRHVVFGAYDPLLGKRTFELRLGGLVFDDELTLEQEQRVAVPGRIVFEVPEDRRDTEFYVSAPDSLHLAAHVPGNAFFRFREVPVRYGTTMRLRFSYLIATGTEGICRWRVTQYRDSPVAWKVLTEGRHETTLPTVGRWTPVDVIFRTEPDATTLALDFRIEGNEIEAGELWIDDVRLEPVGATSVEP